MEFDALVQERRRANRLTTIGVAVAVVLSLGVLGGIGFATRRPVHPTRPAAAPSGPAATADPAATPLPQMLCPDVRVAEPTEAPLPSPPRKAPDFDTVRPVEQVWPNAVRTLPAVLPDGRGYRIDAALGGNRYLVEAANMSDFGIYAATEAQYVPLVSLPGGGWRGGALTINGDTVAWLESRAGVPTQIWTARLGTCQARLAVTDEPLFQQGTVLMLVGDRVVWARNSAGATGSTLMSAPVDGGAAAEVEGGANLLPWASPWAKSSYGPPRFLNVATGAEVTPVLDDGTKRFVCSPVWCAGQTSDLVLAVQRADGTGRVASRNNGQVNSLALGRFACGSALLRRPEDDPTNHGSLPGQRGIVWDLKTGLGRVS